jgi:hypothetical protein
MSWSFRQGAVITFMRDDGQPGPGKQQTYRATDGWKVELQDEGCVQLTNWKSAPPVFMVLPYHRIYEMHATD